MEFQAAAIEEVCLGILRKLELKEDVFLKMIAESGTVHAAKLLLARNPCRSGFAACEGAEGLTSRSNIS